MKHTTPKVQLNMRTPVLIMRIPLLAATSSMNAIQSISGNIALTGKEGFYLIRFNIAKFLANKHNKQLEETQ